MKKKGKRELEPLPSRNQQNVRGRSKQYQVKTSNETGSRQAKGLVVRT